MSIKNNSERDESHGDTEQTSSVSNIVSKPCESSNGDYTKDICHIDSKGRYNINIVSQVNSNEKKYYDSFNEYLSNIESLRGEYHTLDRFKREYFFKLIQKPGFLKNFSLFKWMNTTEDEDLLNRFFGNEFSDEYYSFELFFKFSLNIEKNKKNDKNRIIYLIKDVMNTNDYVSKKIKEIILTMLKYQKSNGIHTVDSVNDFFNVFDKTSVINFAYMLVRFIVGLSHFNPENDQVYYDENDSVVYLGQIKKNPQLTNCIIKLIYLLYDYGYNWMLADMAIMTPEWCPVNKIYKNQHRHINGLYNIYLILKKKVTRYCLVDQYLELKKSHQKPSSGEAEAKRKAEAEAEAKRKADAEAERKRLADEAEAKRKAEAEAERKRLADEAEAKRKAEAEAERKRLADEAEAKRKAEAEAKRKAEDYIVSSGRKNFFSNYYNIFLQYLKKISLKKDINKDIVEYLLNISYDYAGRMSPTVINECICGVKECKNSTSKETHIHVSHKCLLDKLNKVYNRLFNLSTENEHMVYVFLELLSPLLGVLIFWSQSSNREYSVVSNNLLDIFSSKKYTIEYNHGEIFINPTKCNSIFKKNECKFGSRCNRFHYHYFCSSSFCKSIAKCENKALNKGKIRKHIIPFNLSELFNSSSRSNNIIDVLNNI